ncbi:DUF2591 family protein [Pseudomonas asiatica]|uniref:phage protein NinX family protein n=1 Tax=Pseudomonas asiatica TaxID=2219225 RepID=UPI0025A25F38|nr:phage protein NinX family protein [Pseudomonas asiatica]MDM9589638.1 DUF2591 family protein [Pseudomonas asiatica]WJM51747.1 DUF2591 family protein [Pseudomonas asiatica]
MTDLIEVRVSNLSGEALGWAVGKAEGLDVYLEPPGYNGVPWRVFARYQGQAIEHTKRYNPWEDWALAGALVDKYRVCLDFKCGMWSALGDEWVAGCRTPLIAICRAVVAAKLGDTVQVPKELITCPA